MNWTEKAELAARALSKASDNQDRCMYIWMNELVHFEINILLKTVSLFASFTITSNIKL